MSGHGLMPIHGSPPLRLARAAPSPVAPSTIPRYLPQASKSTKAANCFADFCQGWINKFDPETKTVTSFKSGSSEQPVDLKVSEEGDLYFLARGTGSVEKVSYP